MRYVEGAALKLPEGNLRFLLGFGAKPHRFSQKGDYE